MAAWAPCILTQAFSPSRLCAQHAVHPALHYASNSAPRALAGKTDAGSMHGEQKASPLKVVWTGEQIVVDKAQLKDYVGQVRRQWRGAGVQHVN